MKKVILSIVSFMALLPCVFAQKNIDVDNVYFAYTVRNFPQDPQTPILFSYGKDIVFSTSASLMIDKDVLMNDLMIQGQQFVEQPKSSDRIVKLKMDRAKLEAVKPIRRETTKDDKPVISYYMEVKVSGSSSVSINKDGKEIWQMAIRKRDKQVTFETKDSPTPSECKDNWDLNKESFVDQLTNGFATEDVKATTKTLSALFGFQLVQVGAMLETMDTKKHPENEAFKSNVNQVKAILSSLNGDKPLSESQMQPFIDYFKSIAQKYPDLVLKADIKIRYAAYYNLAQIYACMDKFTEAISYCDALIANGFDKKDGENLKTELFKTQSYLSDKAFQVRQFVPEEAFGKP